MAKIAKICSGVYPLSPIIDQRPISPHRWHQCIITHALKEMLTKDELSRCLSKFYRLVLNKLYKDQWGEYV